MSHKKWVYSFNAKSSEGSREMKSLLGGKGANLAEMAALGLPVPPGFTVSTEACLDFGEAGNQIAPVIKDQVCAAIENVERIISKKFGSPENPLLLSIRSGARRSMPGMMDTVLNLGLNEKTVRGIIAQSGNDRFAWDAHRRFIQMYANVVMGIESSILQQALEKHVEARKVRNETELTAEDFEDLTHAFTKLILEHSGRIVPADPMDQLWQSVAAVFGSWNNPRAVTYRNLHGIPHTWGTAVNVQTMVFGNMGEDSATGVCFTRDPATGANTLFGEYLINAQGEDVVAGTRNPAPINDDSKNSSNEHLVTLADAMPGRYMELCEVYMKLERHYQDMQDIEFTVEKGTLYILQTRSGNRTAAAALKIAVDMKQEGLLSRDEALLRVKPEDLDQLLHDRLDPNAPKTVIATGLPASPGVGAGEIVFEASVAQALKDDGRKVILVRQETSPDDIEGMVAAEGILTAKGGMTSHAAVVARGMGKPCIAGCSAIAVDCRNKLFQVGGRQYKAGETITIDGASGEVIQGLIPKVKTELSGDFETYMGWADEVRRLKVRTNADTPGDSAVAVKFGAEGIGLCRTEHMFFDPERILAMREMIFAEDRPHRERALAKILPYQRSDFLGIFQEMNHKPVNIRLLDPPLHEFLPQSDKEKSELASALGIEISEVEERGRYLHEFNPMLGHRGCRLGITYPEIYRMQVRAIAEAALEAKDDGFDVIPEIMLPLVALNSEYLYLQQEVKEEIGLVFKERNASLQYKLGTMIELPRAALTAAEIAKGVEFFSFGTNDLTQTTFGLSRDDSGEFLSEYASKGLLAENPFVTIDPEGVGFLIKHACVEGRKANPDLHLGICGEHGGEPKSVEFCHLNGLDYVSCSPYRVPIARLAAAQAAINEASPRDHP